MRALCLLLAACGATSATAPPGPLAGQRPHELDAARIAALETFVEEARIATKTPGIAIGIVQHGKVVLARGFGVREVGKPDVVDADTKFMIGSETKALTTLMLAKLVDQQRLRWDAPASAVFPSFQLGDAETTRKVQIQHLVCACTGMPRADLEWLFEWDQQTPATTFALLARTQPTTAFGELFQYSNTMASAAGFIGGHVAFPALELGAAYDHAMQTLVFTPLGMTSTTFDFARGRAGNAAVPHALDLAGEVAVIDPRMSTSVIPIRPTGGAWASTRDMLAYVQLELAQGALPSGAAYIGADALRARLAPQVTVEPGVTYGMGLFVDRRSGITTIHHGGDIFGFPADMRWMPELGVGLVIAANGNQAEALRGFIEQRLLELLLETPPQAAANLTAAIAAEATRFAAWRAALSVPAVRPATGLAPRYRSTALGDIVVTMRGPATVFDFGAYASEVASRTDAAGVTTFVPVAPGSVPFELVAGTANGKRTLTLSDEQRRYVFTEP